MYRWRFNVDRGAVAFRSDHQNRQMRIPLIVTGHSGDREPSGVNRSHAARQSPVTIVRNTHLALGKVASTENAVIGDHMAVMAATENLARGWDLSEGIHWLAIDEDISVAGLFAGQPSVEYREAYA